MGKITKTFRGLPLQKYVTKSKSKLKIYRGAHIARYHLSESDEYLPTTLEIPKLDTIKQPKIMSQRIVAHVTKPVDHIIIMSTIDRDGSLINFDTIENTIITDKTFRPEVILAMLNSKLIAWYTYRYIFAKAIRTMDFDDYYVAKIPVAIASPAAEKKITNLVNNMLDLSERLNEIKTTDSPKHIELKNKIEVLDKEIDDEIYRLFEITEKEKGLIENGHNYSS